MEINRDCRSKTRGAPTFTVGVGGNSATETKLRSERREAREYMCEGGSRQSC